MCEVKVPSNWSTYSSVCVYGVCAHVCGVHVCAVPEQIRSRMQQQNVCEGAWCVCVCVCKLTENIVWESVVLCVCVRVRVCVRTCCAGVSQ